MQNHLTHQNAEASPFFSLMSDAEQISVQEVETSSEGTFEDRTFLVKIRPKKNAFQSDHQILENAKLLLNNGDYLLARNLFSFLLRKNLRNESAMEGLGRCFFKLKEAVAAKKCFRALWEMHQKPNYAVQLGLCYLAENDEASALSLFEQVKEPDQIDTTLKFEYFKSFGNLLIRKEKWSEAEDQYHKALLVEPESASVYTNLGTLELQRGQIDKARNYFEKGIELDSRNSKGYGGLGLVYLQLQEPVKALEAFEKALECDSWNTIALKQMISLADQYPDIEKLFQKIEKFLEKEPSNGEIRYQYARLLTRTKKFSRALDQIERAARTLPQDSRVLELRKIVIQNRHQGAI